MKRFLTLLSLAAVCSTVSVQAQNKKKKSFDNRVSATNQNGTYVLRDFAYDSRVLEHVAVSEDDIYWYKDYISAINLKMPVNQPLFYPVNPTLYRKSFATTIIEAVLENKIVAYDDEYFQNITPPQKVQEQLFRVEENTIEDWETGEEKVVKDTINVTSDQIIELLIREEKFFDKKRSVMDSRILGICPVALIRNKETGDWEKQKLFWFYYPDARQLLANANMWNRSNNFERLTMDEFFTKKLFTSVIKKESNMQDRSIFDYNKRKVDQLLEAERIKEELRLFEHQLWNY
jgi:gliding motility associated protien GldN